MRVSDERFCHTKFFVLFSHCLIRNIKTFQSLATSVPFTSRHGITLQKICILVRFVVRTVNTVLLVL